MDIFDELSWRGLVAQTTGADALRDHLAQGPVTLYCGFDPTAASLHHGHLVQLLLLRHLQRAGHRVVALVGGATGLIGDPRMSGERVLNNAATVATWTQRLRKQVETFLDFSGDNPATIVDNTEWLAGMSALDLLRDHGKHFRLGTMLAKDTVARRLGSAEGLSFTEFAYQVLQSVDYLELHRRHDCTLQTGGNDQWGNLVSGVDLVRRVEQRSVHALTTPLITKADGTKFGKTEGGAVWLDPEHMSPFAFYQFWLTTDDADVVRFLKIFTLRTREEIATLDDQHGCAPRARAAHKALAFDVTTLVHGADAATAAVEASRALFGTSDLTALDHDTTLAAVAQLPHVTTTLNAPLIDLFVAAGLVEGRGAARRAIADAGLYVNNAPLTDDTARLTETELLHGRWAVLRRGKRALAIADIAPPGTPA